MTTFKFTDYDSLEVDEALYAPHFGEARPFVPGGVALFCEEATLGADGVWFVAIDRDRPAPEIER